ncbi:ATP-binding protein [bacterium]|nr:ATP-binding protein [bacterium]
MSQSNNLPAWAEEFRRIFRAGTVSQYLLFGSLFDLVPYRHQEQQKFAPLKDFLANVLFAPFEVVLTYNRSAGLKACRGEEILQKYMQARKDWGIPVNSQLVLPREVMASLEFVDSFLRFSRHSEQPPRVALIIDFAEYLAPRTDPSQVSDRTSEILIRLLDWASDPGWVGAQHVTVLCTETLNLLHRNLVENSYSAKLQVRLPDVAECQEYLEFLTADYPELKESVEVSWESFGSRVVGLSRVHLRHMVALALKNGQKLSNKYLSNIKKELIEKECAGLLEFVDSTKSLADVAGMDSVKAWLSHDAHLVKQGNYAAVPMGYLFCGRIGTGKTWLANCFAGELGIPFVVLKNFRDKWMGATESNLEKIFTVLKALGQVLVFVDEADQMTGKRGGGDDGGISGRIYGMLAKEMSDTRQRGKILWVFATSRPDLLEVDLKRPGRLDVHIPLFPPQTVEEKTSLFLAMAQKVGLKLTAQELPPLPENMEIGGNEIEAMMVRVQRLLSLHPETNLHDHLATLLREYRPLSHRRILEYMDLVAVKECTDQGFLPPAYGGQTSDMVDGRLEQLKHELRMT